MFIIRVTLKLYTYVFTMSKLDWTGRFVSLISRNQMEASTMIEALTVVHSYNTAASDGS